MTRRHFVNNAPQRTLSAQITNSAGTCTVSGTFAGWPTQFPFFAELDKGTAAAEVVLVTNIVGSTANITRAQDGTAAISHAAGATFDFVVVAADFDEANAHVNANSGVHGVSGNVVGTSDAQTLTNKTLTAPVLDGNVTSTDGQVDVAAKIAATGDISSGGNVSATGTVTGSSFTANGNGKVAGVVQPKSYTNEAAATTALPSTPAGTIVRLTAPTGGGGVGNYVWDGTSWRQIYSGQPFLGEMTDAGPVTLSAVADFAGTAVVTFTLPVQRRVRIIGQANFSPAGATTGARYRVRVGYNSGSTAVVGSFVQVGQPMDVPDTSAQAGSGNAEGTVLLAAGTYTAYVIVRRATGGAATDTATNFYIAVYDVGAV